jgi:RNA polymerase sigma factor (sigma-70 family)
MSIAPRDTLTAEERVRLIRTALDRDDGAAAGRQFAALLQESSLSTERWLRRVIVMTPALRNASAYPACADLRQELALYLWERIAIRQETAWDHTYWRALIYAQQHVATHYMRQSGYWVDKSAMVRGQQAVASLVVEYDETAEAPDMLSPAEVAGDVRAAVMRLPPKERAAIVLRYWRGMKERDIARALGCTERTVRTLLQQARLRLGPLYDGPLYKGVSSAAAREL